VSGRVICQFSCGAASAVATKLAIQKYKLSHEVVIVNAYVKEEHPDNQRFLRDCEKWFGQEVQCFRDTRYGGSAREVFRRRRFLKNKNGAPCSKILKREVLDGMKRPGDIVVLGYTAEEAHRLDNFIDANNTMHVEAPLIDAGLSKPDVLAMIELAGIELPAMYRMGYHNANCIGCVKGGAGYWNKVRRDFPADFEEMASIEETLGPTARLLRHRSGPLKGQRFYLRELDPTTGRYEDEPDISCSGACELAMDELDNE
jgi:hypothetical protein